MAEVTRTTTCCVEPTCTATTRHAYFVSASARQRDASREEEQGNGSADLDGFGLRRAVDLHQIHLIHQLSERTTQPHQDVSATQASKSRVRTSNDAYIDQAAVERDAWQRQLKQIIGLSSRAKEQKRRTRVRLSNTTTPAGEGRFKAGGESTDVMPLAKEK